MTIAWRLGVLACLTVSPAFAAPATKPATAPQSAIPADAMLVYFNRPSAAARQRVESAGKVTSVLTAAGALGVLSGQGQLMADIVSCFPVVGTHDFAVALLDITAFQPKPETYRLDQLKLALIIHSKGENDPITAHLRRMLSRYTNNSVAALEDVSVGSDKFQRLVDSRVAKWGVVGFGPLDDFYVVTLGREAHEKVIAAYRGKTPSLAQDAWFVSAHRQTGGPDANIEWFVNFEQFRSRLSEVMKGRPEAVIRELGFAEVRRTLWAARPMGTARAWFGMYLQPEGDRLVKLSDPDTFPARHKAVIPAGATHAIMRLDVAQFATTIARAYLAGRSPKNAEALRDGYQKLQEKLGLDVSADLLAHLGPHVIIHDYPPHPLNVPLLRSFLIETDDPQRVRAAVDALLAEWDAHFVRQAEGVENPLILPRVVRDPDGIWYLQVGIVGPAVAITDRYVVVSWSPAAVRAILKFIEAPTQSRPATAPAGR
ncbi:MAG TPA: hypothetical protein VMZ31_08300 [Phycisphaerae bacterium]|nr:hypothetical protein [Phycisphaerae bacterium]